MSEPAVLLENISFSWGAHAGSFSLRLDRFELAKGESVLLTGPSGSGKSTLLGMICGTLVPDSGNISVLGQPFSTLSGSARDRFRADHFGIIFQMFNLLPYLSILDNVLIPLHFSKKRKLQAGDLAQARQTEARRILTGLGLEQIDQQKTSDLSVGQQQRVAAARAFIGAPEIIIADEPTSSLDEGRQADFMELLFAEKIRTEASLLMVSHDLRLADRFDRVINLEDICHIGKVGQTS
ncbi:MAG: methionine ABC transporter ATP-binding protein [Hyphomicrobiales bacterium]|nr:MAG: methionine ABC transporter ATP-binding protein [Hyphomicrobiales bacterium]